MFRVVLFLAALLSVSAFAPMSKVVSRSALKMGVEDLPGAASKGELVSGFWDPLGLSTDKDEATIGWYRAAELKHGRVAMLASLGLIFQELNTGILPSPAFTETNGFKALEKVYAEQPGALAQIVLAIAAVEVFSATIETAPGDFNWDPAGIKPKSEEKVLELQLKELKNGRLAMLGVAGLAYQAAVTGQSALEQINSGHISPFGDGQGFF